MSQFPCTEGCVDLPPVALPLPGCFVCAAGPITPPVPGLPLITSIVPEAVGIAANAADVIITINGTDFTPTSVIMFRGAPVTVGRRYDGPTVMKFTVKPALENAESVNPVTVVDGPNTSNAMDFRFIYTPILTSVDPPCGMWDGPPHQFTLHGANFTNDTQFSTTGGFEWFDLQPGMLISPTEIRTHPMVLSFAEPMKQVQVRDKVVKAPTGNWPLYLFKPPVPISLSTNNVALAATFDLVVTGTDFAPSMRDCATQVKINGVVQGSLEVTATTARVRCHPGTSPSVAGTYPVTVSTIDGYVESATSLPFTFV